LQAIGDEKVYLLLTSLNEQMDQQTG